MIAAQVAQIDESQPIAEILAMRDLVEADLARPRFTMLVLGGFAAATLLMAVIGIYGVIAFGVSQRTREIGIRVALGLRRVLQGLLYGVAANDPVTLLAVAFLLAAVAMLATYVPARRAMQVEPMAALTEGRVGKTWHLAAGGGRGCWLRMSSSRTELTAKPEVGRRDSHGDFGPRDPWRWIDPWRCMPCDNRRCENP